MGRMSRACFAELYCPFSAQVYKCIPLSYRRGGATPLPHFLSLTGNERGRPLCGCASIRGHSLRSQNPSETVLPSLPLPYAPMGVGHGNNCIRAGMGYSRLNKRFWGRRPGGCVRRSNRHTGFLRRGLDTTRIPGRKTDIFCCKLSLPGRPEMPIVLSALWIFPFRQTKLHTGAM